MPLQCQVVEAVARGLFAKLHPHETLGRLVHHHAGMGPALPVEDSALPIRSQDSPSCFAPTK